MAASYTTKHDPSMEPAAGTAKCEVMMPIGRGLYGLGVGACGAHEVVFSG